MQRRGLDAGGAGDGRASLRPVILFILKLNHNELLSYPNKHDQIMFASVKQASDMGAVAGARPSILVAPSQGDRFRKPPRRLAAHDLGLATILWRDLWRNNAFTTKETDFHLAADLSGQANHLGVTIKADIIKQKMP